MINESEIVYHHYNERDVEMPALIAAIMLTRPVNSLLDVGAHYSWFTYAGAVRQMVVGTYHAVDLIECEKTRAIVDQYLVGNVCDIQLPLPQYDVVACVSAIEHSGISTYQSTSYSVERDRVFERLAELAGRELFMTFPFGLEGLHPGQYANVTKDDLYYWEHVLLAGQGLWTVKCQFFYTEFAQGQKPWREITYEEACKVPMDKQLGTQCVCLYHATRLSQ